MICPHCGAENLLGRVTCMSCSKSLLENLSGPARPSGIPDPTVTGSVRVQARARVAGEAAAAKTAMEIPPWEATPAPPAPAVAQREELMCRICMAPFERTVGDSDVVMCPSCSDVSSPGVDMGENEVSLHGNAALPGEDFGSRLGTADFRPTIRGAHRAGVRRGRVAILVGLVLTVATLAVVYLTPKSDPTDVYFREVKSRDARFAVTPEPDKLVRLETTLNLWIVRETMRATFKGELDAVVDVHQRSVQVAEMVLAQKRSTGSLVDVQVECRLDEQRGRADVKDAAEVKIYPWVGHRATHRMLFTLDGPPTTLSGQEFVPGRDVTPLLTLGTIKAPTGKIEPGRRWLADVELPLLADRHGVLFATDFPCKFEYRGRKLVKGYQCVAFRLTGKAPKRPPSRLEGMNRTSGRLLGALFFDVNTGLLVKANVDVDLQVARSSGRIEERVRVQGQMEIVRK